MISRPFRRRCRVVSEPSQSDNEGSCAGEEAGSREDTGEEAAEDTKSGVADGEAKPMQLVASGTPVTIDLITTTNEPTSTATGECCADSLHAPDARISSNIYGSFSTEDLSGGSVLVTRGFSMLSYAPLAVSTVKAKFALREPFFNQIKRVSSGVVQVKTAECRFGYRSQYPYLQVGDQVLFEYGCHAVRASVTRVRIFSTMSDLLNEEGLFSEIFPDVYTAYLKLHPPAVMRTVFKNTLLAEVMRTVTHPDHRLEDSASLGFVVLNVKVVGDSDAESSCALEKWSGHQNTAFGFIKEMDRQNRCRVAGHVYDSMYLQRNN
jgi:ASC-1-like (ASCH) protein